MKRKQNRLSGKIDLIKDSKRGIREGRILDGLSEVQPLFGAREMSFLVVPMNY